MSVEAILKTHPRPPSVDVALLARYIDECGACEASCVICADADMAEDEVIAMVRCIRLCLDCADACNSSLRIAGRQTDPDVATVRLAVEACLAACRACAEECERHAHHHEHCRLCAEECRACERAASDLLGELLAL
jgi:hypothetical protein